MTKGPDGPFKLPRRRAASVWSGAPTHKEAWGAYRKGLREAPQQDGFLVKAVWPVPPVVVSSE
ncbi:hypothetical protein PNF79_004473 [Cronobacter dublinensis]|nr:hypothetical protein [Cronobacter dublinensis]EKK4083728.1 hypothetical protein [Cronobacter dublinensis]